MALLPSLDVAGSPTQVTRTTGDQRNALERRWFVSFGDVFVVEFAFGLDTAGEGFGPRASAFGHHQPAIAARRLICGQV